MKEVSMTGGPIDNESRPTANIHPEPSVPYRLLYPVSEVADLLGFKKSLIYELIARGELDAVRVLGGRIRVPHEALVAFVARQRPATD
jgi:excisionase family DNA binding protein